MTVKQECKLIILVITVFKLKDSFDKNRRILLREQKFLVLHARVERN